MYICYVLYKNMDWGGEHNKGLNECVQGVMHVVCHHQKGLDDIITCAGT